MLQKFVKILDGDPNEREIERLTARAEEINALEPEFEKLTDVELRNKTDEFRARLAEGVAAGLEVRHALRWLRQAQPQRVNSRPAHWAHGECSNPQT